MAALPSFAQMKLNGKVTGAEGKKVILFRENSEDTVKVTYVKNEQFTLVFPKETLPYEVFAVKLEGRPGACFIVPDNGSFTIQSAYKLWPLADKSSKLDGINWGIQNYLEAFYPFLERAMDLQQEVDAWDGEDTAKGIALQNKSDNLLKELQTAATAYVKSHPKSFASLIAIQYELGDTDYDELLKLLAPELQKNPFALRIKERNEPLETDEQ